MHVRAVTTEDTWQAYRHSYDISEGIPSASRKKCDGQGSNRIRIPPIDDHRSTCVRPSVLRVHRHIRSFFCLSLLFTTVTIFFTTLGEERRSSRSNIALNRNVVARVASDVPHSGASSPVDVPHTPHNTWYNCPSCGRGSYVGCVPNSAPGIDHL